MEILNKRTNFSYAALSTNKITTILGTRFHRVLANLCTRFQNRDRTKKERKNTTPRDTQLKGVCVCIIISICSSTTAYIYIYIDGNNN